ncbi:hypothetical protein ACFZAV_15635 [Streptomyces sp. NPDC008343]
MSAESPSKTQTWIRIAQMPRLSFNEVTHVPAVPAPAVTERQA